MELKTKNSEFIFWVLQLVGWSMFSAVIFILPDLTNTFKIYYFLTSVILSISVTSAYRWYLKRNIDFNDFKKNNVLKLFVSLIICALIYYYLSELVESFYNFLGYATPKDIERLDKNSTKISISVNAFIILIWTIIYLGVKFIMSSNANRLENLELLSTLKEAQLNTLKGQVNPHFMFNSLNNIRGLMLEDVDKSREMITKLSGMLEYALTKNTVDAISLKEELEMVDNYIALAKIQMEDRLTFEKIIDDKSLSILIPPMVIQLLVENAAKHGIANLKNGGKIALNTLVENQELSIEVRNTGKLRISEDSTKLGLKNIEQRLRILYGHKANFSLNEIEEEVVAIIKIPIV